MVNIAEKRKEAGYTQIQIAQKCRVAQSMICNIENGKRRPSPEVAMRIADVLGFNWTQFYEKSDDVVAFEGREEDGRQ